MLLASVLRLITVTSGDPMSSAVQIAVSIFLLTSIIDLVHLELSL